MTIPDTRLREIAEAATRSVIPFVSAEERADMAAELLRLREAIREHCATFCQPFLPARHAPECLAHELEGP